MPRLIEILMFVAPFVAFAIWRLLFPAPLPPAWLVGWVSALVLLAAAGLFWSWFQVAGDARQDYVPARVVNGHVVPARRVAPP